MRFNFFISLNKLRCICVAITFQFIEYYPISQHDYSIGISLHDIIYETVDVPSEFEDHIPKDIITFAVLENAALGFHPLCRTVLS